MTWLLGMLAVVAATYGLWIYARWVDDIRFNDWFGPRGTTLSWNDEDRAQLGGRPVSDAQLRSER